MVSLFALDVWLLTFEHPAHDDAMRLMTVAAFVCLGPTVFGLGWLFLHSFEPPPRNRRTTGWIAATLSLAVLQWILIGRLLYGLAIGV